MNNQYGKYYGSYPNYGYPPQKNAPSPEEIYLSALREKTEKREIRRISLVIGACFLGLLVGGAVIGLFLGLIPGFHSAYQANPLFAQFADALFTVAVFMIPFALGFLYFKRKGVLTALPLGKARQGTAILPTVLLCTALCLIGNYAGGFFSSFLESLFHVTFELPKDDFVMDTPLKIFAGILRTAFIPALTEEFALRGVLMQPLRKYGNRFALVISAAMFALMHGNMVQIPFAFLGGLIIGYAVIQTGTMWTGILIHFANNMTAVLMWIANDNLPEKQASLFALLLIVLVMALGAVGGILVFTKYRGSRVFQEKSVTRKRVTAFLFTPTLLPAMCILIAETIQYTHFGS